MNHRFKIYYHEQLQKFSFDCWPIRVEIAKELKNYELSVRTSRLLESNNIKTVFDLIKFSENDLFKLDTCGIKSLVEIKLVLRRMGISLRPNDN